NANHPPSNHVVAPSPVSGLNATTLCYTDNPVDRLLSMRLLWLEFADKSGWALYNASTEIMKAQSLARQTDWFKALNQPLLSAAGLPFS
ncbi:MAG: hypothetical protein WCT04_26820, partial [Planctomycetota bacterium]